MESMKSIKLTSYAGVVKSLVLTKGIDKVKSILVDSEDRIEEIINLCDQLGIKPSIYVEPNGETVISEEIYINGYTTQWEYDTQLENDEVESDATEIPYEELSFEEKDYLHMDTMIF